MNERFRPEFRAEVFNLFNHFNPDPNTVDRNIRSQPSERSAVACVASRHESSNWEQNSTSELSPFAAFATWPFERRHDEMWWAHRHGR